MTSIKWMKSIQARNPVANIKSSPHYKWSAFNRDYGQIVHSDFFKRLAGKTQVHSFPINDHVRTRMTHSVEVSQIGRNISRYFSSKLVPMQLIDKEMDFNFSCNLEELTASAGLMHDTGHPPFGHTGTEILDNLAKKYAEDFNDNKQVVRLLIDSVWNEKFDPSGPLVTAVMKKIDPQDAAYKNEVGVLNKVIFELGLEETRHPASFFMEAADDLAYIAADLSDYIRYFMDLSQFQSFLEKPAIRKLQEVPQVDYKFDSQSENLFELLSRIVDHKGKKSDEAIFDFSSGLIKSGLSIIFQNIDSFFSGLDKSVDINQIPLLFGKFSLENSYKQDLNLLYLKKSPLGEVFYNFKKNMYKDHILEMPYIGSQNLLAKKVLVDLFEYFEELINTDYKKSDVFKMLPMDCRARIIAAHDQTSNSTPARVVVDFISGMTDDYAIKMWESLTHPHRLSIAS